MTAHEALLLHFALPTLPAPAPIRAATLIISPTTTKILVRRSEAFTAKISLAWEGSWAQLGLCAAARVVVMHMAAPPHAALPMSWGQILSLRAIQGLFALFEVSSNKMWANFSTDGLQGKVITLVTKRSLENA